MLRILVLDKSTNALKLIITCLMILYKFVKNSKGTVAMFFLAHFHNLLKNLPLRLTN